VVSVCTAGLLDGLWDGLGGLLDRTSEVVPGAVVVVVMEKLCRSTSLFHLPAYFGVPVRCSVQSPRPSSLRSSPSRAGRLYFTLTLSQPYFLILLGTTSTTQHEQNQTLRRPPRRTQPSISRSQR
jgi:hypothetical protein